MNNNLQTILDSILIDELKQQEENAMNDLDELINEFRALAEEGERQEDALQEHKRQQEEYRSLQEFVLEDQELVRNFQVFCAMKRLRGASHD